VGAPVTIDAIVRTRAEIAGTILSRGGDDDLPALKANPPATLAEVAAFFADPPPGALDTFATTDGDHGRIEVGRHAVCHDVGRPSPDRRYPGEAKQAASPPSPASPRSAGSRARPSAKPRSASGATTSPPRPGSTPAPSPARRARPPGHREPPALGARRGPPRRPLARLRTGHGPENMAVVKHMAMNPLRRAEPATGLKNRRKLAGWNPAYLHALIRQTTRLPCHRAGLGLTSRDPSLYKVQPRERVHARLRRGGRAAEGDGLLNRYTPTRGIVGSNPIPSVRFLRIR
jgi:hypothetical protein